MAQLHNNLLCQTLGCQWPIVLAGMGGVSRSELVAAVTAAGGFGFLGMVREPVALIEQEIADLRQRGVNNFGVNLIPAATEPRLLTAQVDACIRLGVPTVGLFWDIDRAVIERCKKAGIKVVYQIGSTAEAIAAAEAGADIIIAQGQEAGGHVRGTQHLHRLLSEVVEAVNVPVAAAGGMATGRDLICAMALGAQGMVMGTALMATRESFAHPFHKQALLDAAAGDTRLTTRFHVNWPPGAAVRVLKSALEAAARSEQDNPGYGIIGAEGDRPIHRFSTDSPLRNMSGQFAEMALYAGTGVGSISDIPTAAERLESCIEVAGQMLVSDADIVEMSSPACYADEMSGAYMGQADSAEVAEILAQLAPLLRNLFQCVLADNIGGQQDRPPFFERAGDYARWVLLLDRLAANAGVDRVKPAQDCERSDTDTGQLAHQVLDRLGRLVPRLPESQLRRDLSPLAGFIETMHPLRPI
ncbi:nitronate monooxygenase [Devosia rhodophyticola]|uniref:Nitronate monooxygenase n=1 Tax=Devosia rhodophyticola TaxID=3026423 RepID=A0ABY7Z072_9HYPH|nr:nitronate monooxygenase [Devosia rhodophyticola]WDR06902.1 nitronate monooxygenase [Devosia rhodophyticola]